MERAIEQEKELLRQRAEDQKVAQQAQRDAKLLSAEEKSRRVRESMAEMDVQERFKEEEAERERREIKQRADDKKIAHEAQRTARLKSTDEKNRRVRESMADMDLKEKFKAEAAAKERQAIKDRADNRTTTIAAQREAQEREDEDEAQRVKLSLLQGKLTAAAREEEAEREREHMKATAAARLDTIHANKLAAEQAAVKEEQRLLAEMAEGHMLTLHKEEDARKELRKASQGRARRGGGGPAEGRASGYTISRLRT